MNNLFKKADKKIGSKIGLKISKLNVVEKIFEKVEFSWRFKELLTQSATMYLYNFLLNSVYSWL